MSLSLVAILALLTPILWIWAFIDVFKSNFENGSDKILVILLIIFLPILGPIIYFQLKHKRTRANRRKFQPKFNKR